MFQVIYAQQFASSLVLRRGNVFIFRKLTSQLHLHLQHTCPVFTLDGLLPAETDNIIVLGVRNMGAGNYADDDRIREIV